MSGALIIYLAAALVAIAGYLWPSRDGSAIDRLMEDMEADWLMAFTALLAAALLWPVVLFLFAKNVGRVVE